jgi:predicted phosphohydrolase
MAGESTVGGVTVQHILSRGGTHYYWSYTYKHLREAFKEAAKYQNKIYYTLIALEEDVMTAINLPK